MAKKRVHRLKSAGLVIERPRRIGEPSILHLTWKGYVALKSGGHVPDDSQLSPKTFQRRMAVSDLTLAHELAIADVRVAFTPAVAERKHFTLMDFDVWPRRYDFSVSRGYSHVSMKPDGFIRLAERRDNEEFEYDFFLEVDTGSETLERVVEKCINYREHFRSGEYAMSCGGKREDAKSYPFRVLITCRSDERRNNLIERLLATKPPFASMILVATHPECVRDPFGAVWMTPASYKEVMPVPGEPRKTDTNFRLCSMCE